MLSQYKSRFEKSFLGLGRALKWMHPNVLTIIGIIPQLLFFFFMRDHQFGWALVTLIATPIDMLDGLVARVNNKVTAFGGILDSTADRVADFFLIAGLYVGGLANLPVSAALVLITFLVSYLRSRGELAANAKIKFDVGIMERPERIILIFLIVVAKLYVGSLVMPLVWLLVILSVWTVLQRLWFAYINL